MVECRTDNSAVMSIRAHGASGDALDAQFVFLPGAFSFLGVYSLLVRDTE